MSRPSDFAHANIDEVVEALTLPEAIDLVAGVGFWHTASVPRLKVPAIKVSDGPNGVRGNRFHDATPAKAIPCATALGSTFDPELINTVAAKLLASEAKLRAASVLLAPTVNIQRSPLGGRSFESFSEDPHLSGTIAAAYVNGLQKEGIAACIKHFVANDQEDDRNGCSSEVSPRALREIYLMPFMLAQKYAKPWAYMTAYNKVNGLHVSENPFLLTEVLRNQWKSDALIMSDWFGTVSISDSLNAGLDLEMPGVNKFRSQYHTSWSVFVRKTTAETVKKRARKTLELVQKCAKGAPKILDGDGEERSNENEEDTRLMESLAAQTIVLLKNNENILPLQANALKKVAIIGGNAKANVLSGGGSASLKPSFLVNPFNGIKAALGSGVEILYTEGAQTFKTLPGFEREVTTADGRMGFDAKWYSTDDCGEPLADPVATTLIESSTVFIANTAPESLTPKWILKMSGTLKPREKDGRYNFGCFSGGRTKLYIDDNLVVDNWTTQKWNNSFFGNGTEEERGEYTLKAGVSHKISMVFSNVRGPQKGEDLADVISGLPALQYGAAPILDPDAEIEKAVALAKEAEVAVLVVGLNADWETEGYDRTDLKLPGRTDELIKRVAQVNPKTVVITQSGSAIEMPWVDDVAAILHSWYLGNVTGTAIADVLFGKINPCAKLPLTFPKRLEDTPSYGHFGSQNGRVWYAEDLFVGYKHYVKTSKPTLFSFGHGLSYSSFKFSDLKVSAPTGDELEFCATVKVTNTGAVAGSEIVQIYVTPCSTTQLTHPIRSLRGFGKARDLKPGDSVDVEVKLNKYALSYWCTVESRWKIEKGTYSVIVGSSAESVDLQEEITVPKETYWDGL